MKERWVWLALLATAAAVRISHAASSPVIQRDGVVFLSLARAAEEGDPRALLRHDQHPLYPALVALAHPLTGGWESAGLLVSIAAGVLTVLPVVFLGNRVAGAPAGMIGGWFFAVARYPVQYGGSVLSDALHGLFFAAAAWAGAAALGIGGAGRGLESGGRDPGPWRGFSLAGLLSGLAYLTRPEGLIIAASFSIALLGKVLGLLGAPDALRAGRGVRSLLAGGGLFALALLASAGPYAAHLTLESGRITLTRKKPVVETITATAVPPPAPAAVSGSAGASDGAAASPSRAAPAASASSRRLQGALRSIREFAEGLGWIPAGLFLIGLIHRRRSGGTLLAETLLLLPLLALVVLLSGLYVHAGYTGRRHFYPLTPLVEGWAGLGMVALGAFLVRARPARWARAAPAALAALAVLAMLPKSAGLLAGPEREKDLWCVRAGDSLRSSLAPSDLVLAGGQGARVAFYSGARVVVPPLIPRAEDLGETCAEAARRGARWVVLDADPGEPGADPPSGWSLAHAFNDGGREVRLYRRAE